MESPERRFVGGRATGLRGWIEGGVRGFPSLAGWLNVGVTLWRAATVPSRPFGLGSHRVDQLEAPSTQERAQMISGTSIESA